MSVVNTKEQNVDVDTPKTKAVKILPKKRPYVPEIQTEEKHMTHIMAIVTKQTEEVKEDIAGSQTEPVRNQSEVTDKKTQASELAASDKTTAKPASETRKRQCQKESTSQPSTSQPSTSQASTSKASKSQPSTSKASTSKASTSKASISKASTSKASTSKASTSKPLASQPSTSTASTLQPSTSKASKSKALTSKASTSKASSSKASTSKASISKASTSKASTSKASTSKALASQPSTSIATTKKTTSKASTSVDTSSSNDSEFWVEAVESNFQSDDYKKLLIKSKFSESQATSLQKFFNGACRFLSNIFKDHHRLMKTHKCRNCLFSISHQCVSIHYLHAGSLNSNLTDQTFIPSQTTIFCLCKFAFFHTHNTKRNVETSGLKLTLETQVERAAVSCAGCDKTIEIDHPLDENTDCSLKTWSAINSSDEKTFHTQLVDNIKNFTTNMPSFQELYTCNCCLIFHRCA